MSQNASNTSPTVTGRNTRQSQQQQLQSGSLANVHGRNRTELLRGSQSRITDKETGWNYLTVKVLGTEGEKPTTAALEIALLLLAKAPNVPLTAIDGIRAVALCLRPAIEAEAGTRIAEMVREEVMGSVTEMVESTKNLAENTVATVKRMTEEAREFVAGHEAPAAADTRGGGPMTYADVLRANAGPMAFDARHQEVVDRSDTREKQILIDPVEGEQAGGIKELAVPVLMQKATRALEDMGLYGADKPPGTAFHSVKKLPNGGAVYEMTTVEGAQWLRQPEVKESFMKFYGVLALFKDRTYPVLAEFAPTTLPDVPINAVSMIEGANALAGGEIVRAKWIKAPNHRKPGQMAAHLILAFSSREGANKAIQGGLLLDGKKVRVKKLDPEPRRCLKCQFLGKGHIASECKQIHETCGLCAGQHRTSTCTAEPAAYKCVNCRDKGKRHDHPSSDRLCTTFHEYRVRMLERQPELRYKFYTTGDPTTWVRREEEMHTQNGISGAHTHAAPHSQLGGQGTQGEGRNGAGEEGWNGWRRGEGRGRLAGGRPGDGGGPRRSQAGSRGGHASRSRSRTNTPAGTHMNMRNWLLSSSAAPTQPAPTGSHPAASQTSHNGRGNTAAYIDEQRSRAMNGGTGSWGDDEDDIYG